MFVVVCSSWYSMEKTEMSDLSERLLWYLDANERVDTLHLAALFKVDHQKVIGAVKSLQAVGDVSVAESLHQL
jgi:phenylalanyl-tRNA synthetase alpha chain